MIDSVFATKIYSARLPLRTLRPLNAALERSARQLAREDKAGQAWCAAHGYGGYTSYGSLNDLVWRDPVFADLAELLSAHAVAFSKDLAFDLKGRSLRLDSLWVNILKPGAGHSGHIHPHSLLSGTYYVRLPKGARALRFEDPRLGFMMAAPIRKARAPRDLQPFVSIAPQPGTLILWESWLRHEVPVNAARSDRISISFNFDLGV